MSEERLKIAVFIDFDNIEIGVKSTLHTSFDVGAVLEAIKERGEVVSKVAYGDWTRATDYGRAMSQHAVHMVQRNLTPGGDKNGADINLALDALEMAFTHSHINAFVIVGGDSDFITLVEKLKQYDRKVFVVGGRAFTSQVMQKNCTEFVAYEDVAGISGRGGRHADRGGRAAGEANLASAMPLVRRALKLLADREVLPQLGLLKSTLLQLDSSFSERAYGASSFRDFVQKLAKAGFVTLKGTERSFHVELREKEDGGVAVSPPAAHARASRPAHPEAAVSRPAAASEKEPPAGIDIDTAEATGAGNGHGVVAPAADAAPLAEAPPRLGPVEGFRIIQAAFTRPGALPRFPMYVRQVKQFVRQFDESFDERKYGFSGLVDALRYGQREGLFRLDRDRQGVVRVYPGLRYPRPATSEGAVDGAAAEPQLAEDAATFAVDAVAVDASPMDAGEGANDEIAAASGASVEAVTYDVVTHVDADSGVIDVAPHAEPSNATSPAPQKRRTRKAPATPGTRGRKRETPQAGADVPAGGAGRKRTAAAKAAAPTARKRPAKAAKS